jgi:hypothetical protein
MSFPVALHGPEAVATLGWLIGVLAGVVFDVGLVFAIGSTPRLREHGGGAPVKPRKRFLLRIPAILIVALWLAGFFLGGKSAFPCYTLYCAMSAAIVSGGVTFLLMATAASHIARRSIW